MQKKYANLSDLIKDDQKANKYYNSLPEYVKEQMSSRSSSINSFSSLKDYAENLTRGDN